VEWLLDHGSFICERDDLHAKGGGCPVCEEMPHPGPWETRIMNLFQRCRERRALPCAGGVLDQPEDIMQAFDVIDDAIARHKKRSEESGEREAGLKRAREALRGRC